MRREHFGTFGIDAVARDAEPSDLQPNGCGPLGLSVHFAGTVSDSLRASAAEGLKMLCDPDEQARDC